MAGNSSFTLGVNLAGGDTRGLKNLQDAAQQVQALDRNFRNLDGTMRQSVLRMEQLWKKGTSEGGLGAGDWRAYERTTRSMKDQVEMLRRRIDLEEDAGRRAVIRQRMLTAEGYTSVYGGGQFAPAGADGGTDGGARKPYVPPSAGADAAPTGLQGVNGYTARGAFDAYRGSPGGRAVGWAGTKVLQGAGLLGLYQGFTLLGQAMSQYEALEKGVSGAGIRLGGQFDGVRKHVDDLRRAYGYLTDESIGAIMAMAPSGQYDVSGAAQFGATFGRELFGPAAATIGTMQRFSNRRGTITPSLPIEFGGGVVGDFVSADLHPKKYMNKVEADRQRTALLREAGIQSKLEAANRLYHSFMTAENMGVPTGQAGQFLQAVQQFTGASVSRGVLPWTGAAGMEFGSAAPMLAALSGIFPDMSYASAFMGHLGGSGSAGGDIGFALRARALQGRGPFAMNIPGTKGNAGIPYASGTSFFDPNNPLALQLIMDRGAEDPNVLRAYVEYAKANFGTGLEAANVLSKMSNLPVPMAMAALENPDRFSAGAIGAGALGDTADMGRIKREMGTPGGELRNLSADAQGGLMELGKGLSELRQQVTRATIQIGSAAGQDGLVGALGAIADVMTDDKMKDFVRFFMGAKIATANSLEGAASWTAGAAVTEIIRLLRKMDSGKTEVPGHH